MESSPRTIMSVIIPSLILLVGIGVGGFAIWNYLQAKASVSWPTIEGVIASAEVAANASAASDSRHASDTNYSPAIVYQYRVGDASYTGKRIAFGGFSSSGPAAAQAAIAAYAPGKAVKVYYSPGNPSLAVLEPGVRTQTTMLIIIGGIIAAVGVVLALNSSRGTH